MARGDAGAADPVGGLGAEPPEKSQPQAALPARPRVDPLATGRPGAPAATGARAVVQFYDFSVWLLKLTNRLPRNWRITLGDRIDETTLEILQGLDLAARRARKRDLLTRADDRLQTLRLLLRLAADLGCLQSRQIEHSARQLDEIGRQVGGWLKSRPAES